MNRVEETLRQIVRDSMVRAKLGKPLHRVSPEEASAALEPLADYLRGVDEAVHECAVLLVGLGQQVHRAMHDLPGVDHMMLDEAAEYAGERKG